MMEEYDMKYHTHITKICVRCKAVYPRPRRYSNAQWKRAQYCSIQCRNKNTKQGGWHYQIRNKKEKI